MDDNRIIREIEIGINQLLAVLAASIKAKGDEYYAKSKDTDDNLEKLSLVSKSAAMDEAALTILKAKA
jgi:hypothetical protein